MTKKIFTLHVKFSLKLILRSFGIKFLIIKMVECSFVKLVKKILESDEGFIMMVFNIATIQDPGRKIIKDYAD